MDTADPTKEGEVHAGVRLRGRRNIRGPPAILFHGAESRERGQAAGRLAARYPSCDRRHKDLQVAAAAAFQTRTRQERPDCVVARYTRPGRRQVPSPR